MIKNTNKNIYKKQRKNKKKFSTESRVRAIGNSDRKKKIERKSKLLKEKSKP